MSPSIIFLHDMFSSFSPCLFPCSHFILNLPTPDSLVYRVSIFASPTHPSLCHLHRFLSVPSVYLSEYLPSVTLNTCLSFPPIHLSSILLPGRHPFPSLPRNYPLLPSSCLPPTVPPCPYLGTLLSLSLPLPESSMTLG